MLLQVLGCQIEKKHLELSKKVIVVDELSRRTILHPPKITPMASTVIHSNKLVFSGNMEGLCNY